MSRPLPAPLISVVVPTYQRNDLLRKCLDCLSPGVQTLPGECYEVIVTDDGRSDTAEGLVKEHYPWAKWTEGTHRGPAANRNHGAKLAQGAWLAFTDDDCLPTPGWLEGFYGSHEKHRVLEGKTTCRDGLPSMMYESPMNEYGGCFWSCNIAITKELFEELNGFDEGFPSAAMEDMDLRERIKIMGVDIPFLPDAVVDHPARPLSSPEKRAGFVRSQRYFATKYGLPFRSPLRYAFDHLRVMLKTLAKAKNRRGALAYVRHQTVLLGLAFREHQKLRD